MYYLKSSDKAQFAEITGHYPIYPTEYEPAFSINLAPKDRRTPIQICKSVVQQIISKKHPLIREKKIRELNIGDVCQVDATAWRVASYGLTKL